MKSKLYFIAGHSTKDAGAIAYNGEKEADLTMELRNIILGHISEKQVEYATSRGSQMTGEVIEDNDDASLYGVQQFVNREGTANDFCLDIHFNYNAPNASGAESWVYDNTSAQNRSLAAKLSKELAEIMGIPDRGVKNESTNGHGKLAMLSGINPSGIILEVCFLNETDLPQYHKYKHKIGDRIASIVVQHYESL